MSSRPLLALVLLVGCNPDTGITKFNNVPEASITSHVDGDSVDEGYVITFRGTISDTNHGYEDLVATWFVGADELCAEAPVAESGESLCEAVLGVDDDEVVLEGRDPENATGTARVSLVVNATDAPVAEILTPTPGGRYYAGIPIDVQALVSDAEEDADALVVAWTDETGATIEVDTTPDGGVLEGSVDLDAGNHSLVLTVTDITGKVGTTAVDITVGAENSAPVCAITAPADGDNAELGALVDFVGVVTDVDIPSTELVATWSSDLDGALGGGPVDADGTTLHGTDTLSFGTHVLTLTGTDDTGATCTDTILFSVGTPPDVAIDAPLDGELYNEADLVTFLGTVSDSGTAPDGLALTWESDLDGLLDTTAADATGLATFDADWLTPGDHVVTLTATDADGLYGAASVTFTVNGLPAAPDLAIAPAVPFTTDALVASVTADAVDYEGDPISFAWAWTRDGAATAYTTDTVPADATTRGEVWEVRVTPNDGWGDGTPGFASVTIGNSAPVLANVTLSPDPAWEGSTLTCTPEVATDADGDAVAYSYAWTVDGLSIASTDAALGDTWWAAGDTVACIVTPTDGTDAGAAVTSNSVTIDNSTPTIASVSISPSAAAADDTLTCTASGFADSDGDADATTYAWTVNGVAAGTGDTLAGAFVGGDEVVCTATPFDGSTAGTPLSDTLVIDNTAPVLASVSLTPATPTVSDTLTCAPGVTTDIDGTTAFSYAYAWTIGGGAIGATTATLTSADFESGDVVRCRVTPNDGTEDGAAITSSAVTIQNTAPEAVSVTLSPSAPDTDDTLTATATGTDADGDPVSFTYAWYVDGAVVAATGATLSGTYFARDEEVYVVATPTDGTDTGTPMASSVVTVANSVPSLTSTAITPDPATVSSTLTCAASGYADADGDADVTTYAWTVDGAAAGTGATLSSGFGRGDVVVCTATPDDGTDTGTARTDSITISNTAPVLASVSLTPSSATEASTFTCTPAVATDVDGDAVTYTYAWYVNSAVVAPTSTTLTGTYFNRDSTVYCRVTPTDGSTAGAAVSSSTVTVDNTAPVLASVTLSSATPGTSDTLSASVSASDTDGDTVTYTYAWYVNGSVVAAAGSTLSGATYFDRGDTVYVRVTPTDGTDAGTAMTSSTATVTNATPAITSVAISPTTAYAGTTLTCTVTGYSDADGDASASTYVWTIDGVASGTSSTLSSGFTQGDVVACTVTPNDGTTAGTAVASSGLTISNTVPVLASVALTPTTASESSTLTCTPGATTDGDGTTSFSYTYAWYVNAAAISATSTTLTGTSFAAGDTVSCRVTPSDGVGAGSAVTSNTVTIDNTAPTLTAVTLSSYAPATGDTLTASVTASDADGDTVSYTYAWYVNGSVVAATGTTLSGATYFSRGDTVYVRVTPTDGTDSGTAMSSSTATVANTVPVLSAVALTPATAYEASTLTCAPTATDADSDSISYTYAWYVNSAVVAATSSTLTGTYFSAGNTVYCRVTPSDASGSGTAMSASAVTIANTAPVLSSVTLTPTTAYEASTLTCTASATDADGTTPTYTYNWYVNSALIAPVTSTLTGTYFARGNTVYCSATPSDGTTSGTASVSSTVTISNTAPVISAVTLSPTLVYTSDTITTSVTASDADGDSISYTYAWYINGTLSANTASSLSGTTYFSKTNTIYVRVTPTDGTTSGSASTSSTVTVGNSTPAAPVVEITPEDPEAALDPLVCSLDTAATDADGDSLTYVFTWTKNGSSYTGDTDTSTTSTVPAAATTEDDVFICSATASDGSATSSAGTDTVTVLGASYTIGYASVFSSPGTGYSGTNYNLGQQITVSSAVQLYALGAGLRLADTDNIRMALYTNSGSAPGTLVAYTALTNLTGYPAGDGVEMDVVGGPVSVPAGTYWITVNCSDRVYFNYTTSGGAGNTIAYNSLATTSAFPTSFGSASTYTGQLLGHYMVVR
ncbi:MAG: hypothetical protein Q8P41_12850 [Pseudomonadota bacterium]|nr:hypothetical protein [Pseudomonadota bacterium]